MIPGGLLLNVHAMKACCFTLSAVAVLCFWAVVSAEGGTITVRNTTDHSAGSLRQAINDANPAGGDIIAFDIPTSDPGYDSATGVFTINLASGQTTSGQLTIDKSLTINGPGANVLTLRRSVDDLFPVVFVSSGNVVISKLTMRNGNAGDGGDIHNAANLTVRDCTIADGTSNVGGGINNAGGVLNLIDDTVTANMATMAGGIYNSGTLTMTNCTVANNHGDDGGGIHQAAGSATITSTTISGNQVSNGDGSGIFQAGGSATVRSSIVVGNTGGGGNELTGDFVSQGHNVIGTGPGPGGNACCFTQDSDQIDVVLADAKLGPLQNNGGGTATMALLAGSVAIDAGDDTVLNAPLNLKNDQRGFPRKLGPHVDAGALEADPPQSSSTLLVTTTDEHDDGICGVVDCTLLEALNATNANSNANIINFKPGLSGTINNSLPDGLAIVNPVAINGPGARVLAVSGKSVNRVLNVLGGVVTVAGLTIKDGQFQGANEVVGTAPAREGNGGAINNASDLTLKNCTITANSAIGGAGIFGGGASGQGGGVFNTGMLTLDGCTLSNNTAGGGAGGFGSGNGGASFGGAIFNQDTLVVRNCTLAGNSGAGGKGGNDQNGMSPGNGGDGQGGAVYSAGPLTATNVTLSGNSIRGGIGGTGQDFSRGASGIGDGGGIYHSSDSATVRNTIVAANTATGLHPDVAGGFSVSDHNLIGGSPKLGTLANNGGPTDTIALQADSPAVNAGNDAFAPAKDQRGLARSGASDIGAFEFLPLPTPAPTATPTATPIYTPTPKPTATATATPTTSSLANISTRLRVETGENALIGGFIVTGTQPKKVLLRGIGPSLPVNGALANPFLELHNGSGAVIASNDDWKQTQKAQIEATTIPPRNDLESAIVASLPANTSHYTAVMRGVNNGIGVGLVEVYDLDSSVDSKLANISTRGRVETGDNAMIGGFIVLNGSQKVIVRAIGPSLPVSGALQDPVLELHNANGAVLQTNDNWRTDQEAEIIAARVPPTRNEESAIVRTLTPGNYTAVVRGVNNTMGVALVEVYALN
jgi:hypothetical protein